MTGHLHLEFDGQSIILDPGPAAVRQGIILAPEQARSLAHSIGEALKQVPSEVFKEVKPPAPGCGWAFALGVSGTYVTLRFLKPPLLLGAKTPTLSIASARSVVQGLRVKANEVERRINALQK